MKLSPTFVLTLAAASAASASPLLKRQIDSSPNDLPTPSATASIASKASSAYGFSTLTRSTAAASTASSSSASGANSSGSGANKRFNDTQILQYALTLEHLEATFYNQSLSKLSTSDFEKAGYNASVRNQIYSIGRDEASHVELLTTALGNQSVPACTYNFSSVTDVESFLTTARVLEGVGVSAYLGAAQNISNSTYLETAGSILVVEGQHASYLIAQTDDGSNAIPSPFATPLDFKQVYSLAAPFIESCPANLPITAFPALTLSGGAANGSFAPGEQISVSYNSSNSTSSGNNSTTNGGSQYLAIIQGIAGPRFISLDGGNNGTFQVTLPSNLTDGQMYSVVTTSNRSVTDDNTIAGPAVGYVNIPLPQAPEATGSISSSAASSVSASSTTTGTDGGISGAGAGPTGSASTSSAAATATASGSDSIISSASTTGSSASSSAADASSSQSLSSSIASLGSANIPRPTTTN